MSLPPQPRPYSRKITTDQLLNAEREEELWQRKLRAAQLKREAQTEDPSLAYVYTRGAGQRTGSRNYAQELVDTAIENEKAKLTIDMLRGNNSGSNSGGQQRQPWTTQQAENYARYLA